MKFIHDIKRKITGIARKIAECLNPDKIILFSSYAWGKSGRGSDFEAVKYLPSKKDLEIKEFLLPKIE